MTRRLLIGFVLLLSVMTFATSGEEVTPGGPEENVVGRTNAPPMLLLNNPRCRINYDLRNVGPSGVRQVELYLTRDEGRTWSFYGTHEVRETCVETSDGLRPIVSHTLSLDLLREGVYGLHLLPKSGVGLSKQPPQPGTRPQMVIEVDLTAPTVELLPLKPHPDRHDSVVLSWKVTDRNLAERPVTLEWSATKLGRWQKIVCDIENSGSYMWKLSPNLPAQVYLRVTAKDRAGNIAVLDTPEAVCLDAAEPEAVITSVEAATPER